MPVLFFMGLIGLVFTTVVLINTSLTVTVMQRTEEQYNHVEKLFADTQVAVTDALLLRQLDLSTQEADGDLTPPIGAGKADLTFLSSMLPWTEEELKTDPWGNDYLIFHAAQNQTIYADSNVPVGNPNNAISAYISAFAIVSAGPDGEFAHGNPRVAPFPALGRQPFPTTFNQIRAYTPDRAITEGEDDIYITFTTYAPSVRMWNRIQNTIDKVQALLVNDYAKQLELYTPRIESYFANLDPADVFDTNGNYNFANLENRWRTDLYAQYLADPMGPHQGFPRMKTNLSGLGISEEVSQLANLGLSVGIALTAAATAEEEASITLINNGINEWDITFSRFAEGGGVDLTGP